MSQPRQTPGVGKSLLLNLFWAPLFFQDAVMVAIAVPAALLRLAPHHYVRFDAIVVALAAFASMVVPPVAGSISDRLRRRGIPRRIMILAGAGLDASCLILIAHIYSLDLFMLLVVVATAGNNISMAAYQALIPEIVPQTAWGMVSGVRSLAMVVGTVIGLVVAAETNVASTFIGMGIGIAVGALSLLLVAERMIPDQRQERAHISDWNDFTVVFVARLLLASGMTLLMTFVLYFFKDVLHVQNPSTGTGFVAMAALAGAILSGLYLGWLSDRVSRKVIVSLCGIPMVLAAAGFALFPHQQSMYAFAVLFGIGFGGIMSTGWALAIDSVPQLRDVARDLGIWGIAQNLPMVLAPLAGWGLLQAYHNSLAGYRVLFFAAAGCFALGSATVLAVGKRPFIAWWAVPARIATGLVVGLYTSMCMRVRSFGRLLPGGGSALLISNHQTEFDLLAPMARLLLVAGWRRPVLAACAKMMYEPGWMAVRFPSLWRLLYNVNLGWLFEGMGLLPLENELQSRSVFRWAWAAQRRHGILSLEDLFKEEVVTRYGLSGLRSADLMRRAHFRAAQERYVRLSELKAPYRKEAFDEMRAGVDHDLAQIESALQRGAAFYITPEGDYTPDGRMLPFRGIWQRLEPHARRVVLVAIAYDPFSAGKRLSVIYRVVDLQNRANVISELQAARPVTASALLCEWLAPQADHFTEEEAAAALLSRLRTLPEALFVDPRLRHDPRGCVRSALHAMVRYGVLARSASGYELQNTRHHPDFPLADDIVAHQANTLAETLQAASRC